MSTSDEGLMQDFKDGDESAFEILYTRYKLPIYRYIYRRIGGKQARAEELTQDVFTAVILHRADWQPEATFKSYLYSIAFNRSASEIDRSEYKVMVANEEDDENNEKKRHSREPVATDSPERDYEQGEIEYHVRRALARLDPENRDPILLREYQGLDYSEIAEVLDIKVGTVKSRIARGKQQLLRLLSPLMGYKPT